MCPRAITLSRLGRDTLQFTDVTPANTAGLEYHFTVTDTATNTTTETITDQPILALLDYTAGKTYHDLRQSFLELGLDDAALRRYGVRILKMGMLFPMEPTIVREFGPGAYLRCCLAILRGERTTFLSLVFARPEPSTN